MFRGHWAIARMLIERGARLDSTDINSNTPLHCSAHRADPSFTRYLPDKGAQIDAQNVAGNTPLLDTISRHINERGGHLDILLERGANPTLANDWGFTPLSEACRMGSVESVKSLLKHVPNPSLSSNPLRPGSHSWTPLAEACHHVHLDCVQLLLEVGVDLEIRNDARFTALHQASREQYSSPAIVQMLIDHGAFLEPRDQEELTPLAIAARESTADVVQVLIGAGANINTRSYGGTPKEPGYTPLHLAVQSGNDEVIEVLVLAGAELEAKTTHTNLTALMMAAAQAGERALIRQMLKHGANPRPRDRLGRTAGI